VVVLVCRFNCIVFGACLIMSCYPSAGKFVSWVCGGVSGLATIFLVCVVLVVRVGGGGVVIVERPILGEVSFFMVLSNLLYSFGSSYGLMAHTLIGGR
jgi:hypothetical protein